MQTERTRLTSGTVVESERIPGVDSVAVGLYFPTGSRDETPTTNGITHLIEHLTFKGTPTRTADEINREIDLLGGGANAYTGKETLCFHARVLGDDLPRLLALLGDLAAHALPSGLEGEFERERSVILSEIASVEDSPEDLAGDLSDRAFFGDHPLGLPVVGSASAVSRLKLPEIRTHLQRHLVARNLVAVAAGNVDHPAFVEQVERNLADLPAGEPETQTDAPRPRAGACVIPRELEQAHVLLSGAGLARGDDRRHALELFSAILGEGCSSRLFREVRERRGLAYSIYSSIASYRDAGALHVSFGVAPERLQETLDVVLRVLGEVRRQGVTEAEMEVAKHQVRTGIRLAHESPGVRMAHIAEQALLGREERDVGSILAGVDAVTPAAVRELAAELLAGRLAVGAVGPIPDGLLPQTGLEVPG